MREIVIYTPNYMVKPYELVWDSDNPSVGLPGVDFAHFGEVVSYYKALRAEDASCLAFHIGPNLDPQKFLDVYNQCYEVATGSDMWWQDIGIVARKVVEHCPDCEDKYQEKLDELEEFYKSEDRYFEIKEWRARDKKRRGK